MFSEMFQWRWQLCEPASSHYSSSLSLLPSLPFSALPPSLSLPLGALVSRVKQVKVLSHINIIFHINATWFVINLKLKHATAIEYIYTRPLYIKPLSDRSNQNYTRHERLWLAQRRAWSWVWRLNEKLSVLRNVTVVAVAVVFVKGLKAHTRAHNNNYLKC